MNTFSIRLIFMCVLHTKFMYDWITANCVSPAISGHLCDLRSFAIVSSHSYPRTVSCLPPKVHHLPFFATLGHRLFRAYNDANCIAVRRHCWLYSVTAGDESNTQRKTSNSALSLVWAEVSLSSKRIVAPFSHHPTNKNKTHTDAMNDYFENTQLYDALMFFPRP